MRIVVTGGLGFIGSEFVRQGSQANHEIFIIDKMTYASDLQNVSDCLENVKDISIFDISDEVALNSYFKKISNIDLVVNFAAESHVDRSINSGLIFAKSNIIGVVNLLEELKRNSFGRLIQISTDEIYGSIDSGFWNELAKIDPRSPYSSTKASAELLCKAYGHTFDLPIVITRCANNFGPRQSCEKFIPRSILLASLDENIQIYGDGKNRREWVHVSDHAAAIFEIINHEGLRFGDFNIGGQEKSNIEIAKMLLNIMEKDDSKIEYITDRPGHDFRYSVDDSKLRNLTKWKPNLNFETGIIDTIKWYQENIEWAMESKRKSNL